MNAKTLISVEEFDRLAEPDHLSYELDEGELVVMTKTRPLHNRIVGNLEFELRTYLKSHPIGEASTLTTCLCLARIPSGPGRLIPSCRSGVSPRGRKSSFRMPIFSKLPAYYPVSLCASALCSAEPG